MDFLFSSHHLHRYRRVWYHWKHLFTREWCLSNLFLSVFLADTVVLWTHIVYHFKAQDYCCRVHDPALNRLVKQSHALSSLAALSLLFTLHPLVMHLDSYATTLVRNWLIYSSDISAPDHEAEHFTATCTNQLISTAIPTELVTVPTLLIIFSLIFLFPVTHSFTDWFTGPLYRILLYQSYKPWLSTYLETGELTPQFNQQRMFSWPLVSLWLFRFSGERAVD